MRLILILAFVALMTACGSSVAGQRGDVVHPASSPEGPQAKQAVIVELFTSEGCSSCPPAERQLALLEGQQPVDAADIIALEMHVDYWDYLGWKDPFASREFTARQESYARSFNIRSNYTPQMIVDGTTEFVGSDGAAATRAILESVRRPKADVKLDLVGGRLKAEISGIVATGDADVMLALTEDDVATDVRAGENGGQRLVHRAVVRQLRSIGSVAAGESTAKSEAEIEAPKGSNTEKLRLTVFVQEKKSRRILGAARIAFGR